MAINYAVKEAKMSVGEFTQAMKSNDFKIPDSNLHIALRKWRVV